MSESPAKPRRSFSVVLLMILIGFYCAGNSGAQATGVERALPQSKTAVEQALKGMQNAMAGRLPVLDGFALSSGNSLDRYQRGYYQAKIQVSPGPSGGSVVRISVEVTAWYNDPAGIHSGYQVLPSNGRLEGDLLDQLTEQLAALKGTPQAPATPRSTQQASAPVQAAKAAQPSTPVRSPATTSASVPAPASAAPAPAAANPTPTTPATSAANRSGASISAPMPRIPDDGGGLLASLAQSQTAQSGATPGREIPEANETELRAEAESLEEVLKNQDHPNNLVAVRKSGTPVVQSASLTAKTLFLASAHDEFELLDFTRDWVHVRISGLSRGWIWRNNVEMPDNIPDNDLQTNASAAPVAADLFHVTREEKAPFPGDWGPLHGKTVKIVSVEKTDEARKDDGPHLRLEFAKSVLDKNFSDLELHSQELAGIVLIFDSADGGMIAATLPTLQEWKAGKLSDAALWHQCFFDPPESFTTTTASAGQ
jgi:hypothetical protein